MKVARLKLYHRHNRLAHFPESILQTDRPQQRVYSKHSRFCSAPECVLWKSHKNKKRTLQKPYVSLLGCACAYVVLGNLDGFHCVYWTTAWVNVIRKDNEQKEHVNSDVVHNLAFPE